MSGSQYFSYIALIFPASSSECESLGLQDFPTAERLQWHGHSPNKPDWSETSRFVGFTLVIVLLLLSVVQAINHAISSFMLIKLLLPE